MPVNPYIKSSLGRFLKDVGEEGSSRIDLFLGLKLLKKGKISTSKVVLDFFPVYSYLNLKKYLKIPKFNKNLVIHFLQELKLEHIISKFPKQWGNAVPLRDKLKLWIHQNIWDVLSNQRNHYYIFGKNNRKDAIGLERSCKAANIYQRFLNTLKTLPNAPEIESTIVTEVVRVLGQLEVTLKRTQYQRNDDLCSLFYTPHQLKGPTNIFNYCAPKGHHFIGRGGMLTIFPSLGIPLFLQITPK